MVEILQAQGLRKRYGEREAVAGLSLQVRGGELLALLGPNGAGKSSTVGMLAGLLEPDAGTVQVAGHALAGNAAAAARRRIGLVPQELALFEQLGAQRNLELFGALYGLPRARCRERAAAVLAEVGLAERAQDKPAQFSGGMKRRLHIACALVHEPELLLLDEPTAGVDPQSRIAIFELIESLKRSGKALLYTTHYMEEAERLADRIVIVDHGRVVAEGRLPELLARLPASRQLLLRLDGAPALAPLHTLPGVLQAQASGSELQLVLQDLGPSVARVLAQIEAQGLQVLHLHSGRATLEDVFLQLTGRALRDGT